MLSRWKRIGKRIVLAVLCLCLAGMSNSLSTGVLAAGEEAVQIPCVKDYTTDMLTYCIVLDPGHGGNDSGGNAYKGTEKKLNLLIGRYLREELLKYKNVRVEMTRDKDVFVDLHGRMKYAKEVGADLFVSLHNDIWDAATPYDNGCSVLVAKKGSYRPEMIRQEVYLARNILSELEGIGLVRRGLMRKKSDRVPEYEDGSKGDYHAIIRDGMRVGIPSVLVEHAFCDSKHDYKKFLKNEEKLRNLAAADARGIARFLGLQRKDTGEVLPPVDNNGKPQLCTADPAAYYTMAKKKYYITVYDKVLTEGAQRHQTNENKARQMTAADQTGAEGQTADQAESGSTQEMSEMEKNALERREELDKMNKASSEKMPAVVGSIIGGFALAVLLREVEFGFHLSVKFRKRGDKHSQYTKWEIKL